jgi:acyl-CoA reductase-like NAD-dependent aldehyde dehydrogenase
MTTLAIHNPATGEKITDLSADTAASVATKAAAARAAQPAWAATPLEATQGLHRRNSVRAWCATWSNWPPP